MNKTLEQLAAARAIRIHEPFSAFLNGGAEICDFDISLVDCYRMAGHACHAITGAFLTTEAAVEALYPDTHVCERGDLFVEFGTDAEEGATGPRSNVVSFITGAWSGSGFPGLQGKFKRKNLMSYGHANLSKNAVRFKKISSGESVVVTYDSKLVTARIAPKSGFPESWREEICAVLMNSKVAIQILREIPEQNGCNNSSNQNGCC